MLAVELASTAFGITGAAALAGTLGMGASPSSYRYLRTLDPGADYFLLSSRRDWSHRWDCGADYNTLLARRSGQGFH